MTESIPDDCLPQPGIAERLLARPEIDSAGRITGGTLFDGMTPAEVIADRDAFNAAIESSACLLRKLKGPKVPPDCP